MARAPKDAAAGVQDDASDAADLPPEVPALNLAAKAAALDALEMRVAELAAFMRAEAAYFEDGAAGVVAFVTERLKALL